MIWKEGEMRCSSRKCGIHFIGIVKTNYSGFPKAALEELCGPEKGDSVLLVSESSPTLAFLLRLPAARVRSRGRMTSCD